MDLTKRFGCCVALLLGVLLAPSAVDAQAWLSDRTRAEGPGIRVGDFELHPGIGVELGYDSNLYYSDDTVTHPNYRDSAILRAAAHLYFSSRGAQRAQEGESGGGGSSGLPVATFRGGISGSFYHFFNDNGRTNMEADADLALTILPGRTFSLSLTDTFGRSIRPFTEFTMTGQSYGRIQNNAGLELNIQSDGGVFAVGLGYTFGIDFFEDSFFSYANTLRHTITLSETFRFLPQTGIIHETTFEVADVQDETTSRGPLINDGFLLRTRIGLNGALTTNFSVLAMVGYSAGFFNQRASAGSYDQEYESLNAQVQARWLIQEGMTLVFGYDRDFKPSFVGNFYRRDRGHAAFQALFGGAFMLGIDASVAYIEYGRSVNVDGTMLGTSGFERGDIRLIGAIFGEYRFTDWLGVNATARYTGNVTDYVYDIGGGGGPRTDPAQFNKFELWLGVRVFY